MQSLSRALLFIGILIAFNALATTPSFSQIQPSLASLNPATSWNLMLVGGSMKTCSSMARTQCESDDWIDENTMRTHNPVRVDNAGIERILNSTSWSPERSELREELESALNSLKNRFKGRTIHFGEFSDRFTAIYPNLWDEITDREYYLIRDSLQIPYSELPQEQIYFEGSKVSAGVDLFESFVDRAKMISGEATPRIIVITASARDSFDAVDFYVQAFEHFGAQVAWIPLDAATGHAIATGRCDDLDKIRENVQNSFNQARKSPVLAERQQLACTQPEMITRTIEEAHGIFFNGGDQSLTRQSFIAPDNTPFPWLTALQQRIQRGEMIAGGTSAGTAVMSAQNMISNGTSLAALLHGAEASALPPRIDCERLGTCEFPAKGDQLTYLPEGGLGLFAFGITDTHFSERGRQVRLMRLVADTNSRLGVGVDETTALLINTQTGAFQVQGAHGVFMLANVDVIETDNPEYAGMTGEFHYFRNGSGGVIHDQEVKYVRFSNTPKPDTGDPGTGELLSDRTLTASLSRCQREDVKRFSVGDIHLRLSLHSALLAHEATACEVSRGEIAVIWPKEV